MRAVAAVPPDQAAAARLSRTPYLQRAASDDVRRHDESQAGHANNALPQLARAVVNCRILPGLPGADVEAVIRRLAGDKVKVTVIEPPVVSPPSTPTPALLSRIEQLVAMKQWPGIPVIPVMATGATDGMYTRSSGILTFGVSALDSNPDDDRAHGKDERVGIESFYKATQFWLELMKGSGDDTH